MLTVALLGAGDRVAHERETDALVSEVRAGQDAGVYADRRLSGTVQYASGSLTSSSVPAGVRADLRRLVQQEAAGQLPALEVAREGVARGGQLPWHGDVERGRAAALAHLDARLAHLRAVSRDVRVLYAPRPAVTTTSGRARTALARLVGPGEAARLYR